MGNQLMNSISLEKAQSPGSGFCYARNRVCSATATESSLSITRSIHTLDLWDICIYLIHLVRIFQFKVLSSCYVVEFIRRHMLYSQVIGVN